MAGPLKSNIGRVVGNLNRIAQGLPAAQRTGVNAAAAVMKRGILSTAASRGAHPRDSWVSVTEHQGGALLELRGARAYWAEKGTKPHAIAPKRKKAVMTPMGPRAGVVVRGVRARPSWDAGVKAHAGPAQQAMVGAVRDFMSGR